MSDFRYRGVIEGCYGPPWSHENRLWMIERMGAWGMNLYVYAPKGGPLHRERWREPYPEPEFQQFRETRRIQAALDGLDRILSGPTSSDRCLGFMGFGFRVNPEPAPVAQSNGPRRVFYPQWTSMEEDEMALGSDPVLFRNSCLADDFVDFVEDVGLERLTTQRC